MPLNNGVTVRLTTPTSASFMAAHPGLKLASVWANWKVLQPAAGALDAHTLAAFDGSLSDAHAKGYQLIVRVACGSNSPTWMEHSEQPVKFMDLKSNDPNPAYSGAAIRVPVPWDRNLRYWHTDLLHKLASWASGPCPADASHPRSTHIHSWPLARPTEDGTEMQWGYGQQATNVTYNKAAWMKLGTESENRDRLRQAWIDTAADFLAIDKSWVCSLAGGSLFADGMGAATTLLGILDKARVVPMVTNLRDDWPTHQAATDAWLRKAAGLGFKVGLQFAGVAVMADDMTLIRDAVDYAVTQFGKSITYIEPAPKRYDIPGFSDYMLSVQTKLQPVPPPAPPATPGVSASMWLTLSWPTVDGVTSYEVSRNGAVVVTVAAGPWTDPTAKPDYTYTIIAIGPGGRSRPATVVT